jgi:translation initiation factor 2-alpha kinase 4
MIDSPLLYTPARDLHCIGLVLLQMLLGHDVMTRFTDVQSALHNCEYLQPLHPFHVLTGDGC